MLKNFVKLALEKINYKGKKSYKFNRLYRKRIKLVHRYAGFGEYLRYYQRNFKLKLLIAEVF